jgi:hypothetical protein
MQTFLPLADFRDSLKALDYRRLGKQRVEAMQIVNTLTGLSTRGWINHPAVKMWRKNVPALMYYHDLAIEEWIRRGYRNTMKLYEVGPNVDYPSWFGDMEFHISHQANLYHKSPADYPQWQMDFREYKWPAVY